MVHNSEFKKKNTYQNEVKPARPPLLHGFLTIAREIVFYLFPPHKGRQDRLVDGIV